MEVVLPRQEDVSSLRLNRSNPGLQSTQSHIAVPVQLAHPASQAEIYNQVFNDIQFTSLLTVGTDSA